jgi:uncharacterized membrane protein YkvA (DUF1232 family)
LHVLPYIQNMGIVRRSWRSRTRVFREEVFVLYFAIRDSRTPLYAKLPAFFSLLYLLSPFDLIPDFIPFFGYLDDLVIVPLLLHLSFRLLPAQVRETSRLKALSHARKLRIALVIILLLLVLMLVGIFFLGAALFHRLSVMHW